MNQKDKIDTILKELYKYKYDGQSYSIRELTNKELNLSIMEALDLAKKLKNHNYIDYVGSPDGPLAEIKSGGIEHIEPLIEREQEYSIVINQAWEDYGKLAKGKFTRQNHKFAEELQSLLWEFELGDDQLIYLNELKKILSIGIEEHKKICSKIGNCPSEDAFTKALFIVKRKIKSISSNSTTTTDNFSYTPPDPLNDKELDKINSKLDDILDKLTKVEFGQQVIFDNTMDEFEDIRELLPLIGKKNAMDLIKGKLIDLGLSKAVSMEVVGEVFKTLTGSTLSLT